MAYTTKTQPGKKPGKGAGNTVDKLALARATLPYKGGRAPFTRGYGLDYKGGKGGLKGKYARLPFMPDMGRPDLKGKGGWRPKGGKGEYTKRQQRRETVEASQQK